MARWGERVSAAAWALSLLLASGCVPFHREGFENPSGTDEFYSDGEAVTPGNSVDPNADPADVGSPSGWGVECGKVTIGPDSVDGGALWRHRFSPGSPNGFYTVLDTVVDVDHLEEGQLISIAVAKPEGGPEDPFAAWALYFARRNGETFFVWSVGNFAKWYRYPLTGGLQPGRRYVQVVMYDLLRDVYGWAVDFNPAALGPIPPTYFQNLGTLVIGSSESSTGRDSSYYVDNVFFGEVDPTAQALRHPAAYWLSDLAARVHESAR
jgi:hypothetical protein